MFSTNLRLIISLAVPLAAGYALLTTLFRGKTLPLMLKIPLSYGLGLGLLSVWMLILGALKQPFSFIKIGLPLIIIPLICMIFSLSTKKALAPESLFPVKEDSKLPSDSAIVKTFVYIFYAVIILYIAFQICYVFWRSMSIPIYGWDAFATIAYKAKVFYFDQTLENLPHLPHPAYPLFVPFIESWTAYSLQKWDDQLIKIIFPCTFLSYLAIHYTFLKHYTSRAWALLGCALLLSSNLFIIQATVAYRDFFLLYFNCTTFMLLLLWGQNRNGSLLLLAGFFSGMTTFVKIEGSAYLIIHFILFLILNWSYASSDRKEKIVNTVKFAIPSFGICLMYHLYKLFILTLSIAGGTGGKTTITFNVDRLVQIPTLISSFLENLFLTNNWGIVWFIFVLSLLQMIGRKPSKELKLIFLCLALFFALYFVVALTTSSFMWFVGDESLAGLGRIFLHFFPLTTLAIILLNYKIITLVPQEAPSLTPVKYKFNQISKKKRKRSKKR